MTDTLRGSRGTGQHLSDPGVVIEYDRVGCRCAGGVWRDRASSVGRYVAWEDGERGASRHELSFPGALDARDLEHRPRGLPGGTPRDPRRSCSSSA